MGDSNPKKPLETARRPGKKPGNLRILAPSG
jgi:hypothetical protein